MTALERNFLDKAIGYVSPGWANRRMASRAIGEEIKASYAGAVPTRQDTPWTNTMGQNPNILNNGLAYGRLQSLRDRSNALCQNNPLASGIIGRAVDNLVGNGFNLHPLSADPEWNKRCYGLFSDWFDYADLLGHVWDEHLTLAFTHMLREGDIGGILLKSGQIQPIVPGLINTPTGKAGDPSFVDGVEISQFGRPLRYWIDQYDGYTKKVTSTPVDADNFLFVARKKSFTQTRGEPAFATSAPMFDQLSQWQDAVVRASKTAAFLAFALKKANPANFMSRLPQKTQPNGEKARELKMQPGSLMTLLPNEDIVTISSGQPAPNFPEAFVLNVRTLGLELGMPLELVLLDFSKTNYSSARAALLQAYRGFRRLQNIFIRRYLARIYRWRVSKWINEGKLEKREDAFTHRWIPTPWPYLDPLKELQATQMSIDIGLDTLSSALVAVGRDFEDWLTVRTKEVQQTKSAGIPLMHSAAMQTFDSPAAPATPPANNPTLPPVDDPEEQEKEELDE